MAIEDEISTNSRSLSTVVRTLIEESRAPRARFVPNNALATSESYVKGRQTTAFSVSFDGTCELEQAEKDAKTFD